MLHSNIKFRNYTSTCGITADYFTVRSFLIERGYCEFTYARWDWMATHSHLQKESISKIGLWEDNGSIVAVATFDCHPGDTFLITLPGYDHLKPGMIAYAQNTFGVPRDFGIVISDADHRFQSFAAESGLIPTPDKEFDAIFYPTETSLEYQLPKGFAITDMKTTYDLRQYERVLWKGFNHELNGEGLYDATNRDGAEAKYEMQRPNVDLSLKIAAVTPDGNFGAYCGMWYDTAAGYGVIEPVATDPDYRNMGLGRAVVLEGVKRVCALGAEFAVVGSAQQFYYSIGLRPYATSTKWKLKDRRAT